MKDKLYPVVGIHTAGKTILLKSLSNEGYMVFFEIAQQLIDKGIQLASSAGDILQKKIMEIEFERDTIIYEVLHKNKCPVFIETWHIGNLAHCKVVAPNLYPTYLKEFKERLSRLNNLCCFYLYLDPTEIIRRTTLHNVQNEPAIVEFHSSVGNNLEKLLIELGIPYEIIDANCSFELVKRQVISIIKELN